MFLLAFHAFLRIGEMAFAPKNAAHLLQISHIQITRSQLAVHFHNFKHSSGRSFTLKVTSKSYPTYCPVVQMQHFLHSRGTHPGPRFAYPPALPISRSEFTTELKRALSFKCFAPDRFHSHSFRIGAATECHQHGLSNKQIRTLGRWKSEAF